MAKSLLISLLGTSKLRPMRIINEKKPDRIYLVTSNQQDWSEATKYLADEIATQCNILYDEDDILITNATLTDFDSVFSLTYRLIENFKKEVKGRSPVYIDVSATTGIAMSAAVLASCLFHDTHVYYLYAKFNPISIKKILDDEETKAKEIGKQSLAEIPKPLVPIHKMEKNGIYHDILLTLRDELGGHANSQNQIVNNIKLRDKKGNFVKDERERFKTLGQVKTKSTPAKYARHIAQLEVWGLIEKVHEIGASKEIILTDFGKSLLKAIELENN